MQPIPPLSILNVSQPKTGQLEQGAQTPRAGGATASQLFSQGQILRAMVVSAEQNNQFILQTGESRVLVQSKTPLQTGQTIDLQVVGSGVKVQLQVIPDSLNQLFGKSFAASANKLDLTSFFSLLRQAGPEQLTGLSQAAQKSLQNFNELQQQILPTTQTAAQPGNPGLQTNPSNELGQKILEHIFNQLGDKLPPQLAAGKDQAALSTLKTALYDVSQLFQAKNQATPATLTQVDNLGAGKQQVFEILSLIQQTPKEGSVSDNLVNRLAQALNIQPQTLFNPTTTTSSLNSLKSGFSDLIFLLKGPESLTQLLSTNSLQSAQVNQTQLSSLLSLASNSLQSGQLSQTQLGSLLLLSTSSLQSGQITQAQVDSLLSPSPAPGTSDDSAGEQLQKLITSIGLDFENKLAARNLEGAVKTVKSGLLELVQNFMGQGKLAEGGKQALSTIEFYQLMHLQLERQDTLILPLPLPFLEQGFLVIEDFRDQLGGDKDKKQKLTHFSLYLKLSPLGNLKVDFLYSEDGVYIRFNSESKAISEYLANFKTELSEAISNITVHGVTFGEDSDDPLTLILKTSQNGETSILDTTV